jgi:predicted ATPase
VQGPQFDAAVAAAVLGLDAADVEERLDALGRVHALVRPVREEAFPDGTVTARYGFVHALYQNALYASLQPARRAAWSAAAAEAVLGHYGEKAAAVAAELALLLEAARDPARAAHYFLLAAENAARVFAHPEAVALARRGLAQLRALPDTPEHGRLELRLQMALGSQLQLTEGYAAAEAGRAFARARELFAQEEDPAHLFHFLWGSWMFYMVRGEMGPAAELTEQLLASARGAADATLLLQASQAAECTLLHRGELADARGYMEQAWSLYDPARFRALVDLYANDSGVVCLGFGALVLWLLGYPDQALKSSRDSVALAREHAYPFSLGFAYYFAAKLHQLRGEVQAARELAEAAQALASEQGFPLWLAGGTFLRGWALIQQAREAEGLAQLRQGLAAWHATGAGAHRSYQLALVAEALGRAGQAEEALTALGEARALADRNGERYWDAELHRLRGEVLLSRAEAGPPARAEAEACFRQALDVAGGQQAKSLELRAAVSLARLYQGQGRGGEARPQLAETYGWFTEGFDTPDLRDAKVVLEELA